MRFSLEWLKEWVTIDLSAEDLAARLTNAGLEADSIEPVAGAFSGVVVGEILECSPHPDADKLRVCRIDAGNTVPLQVVCGAPNARAGIKVPFAPVGAKLGPEITISKARLRGVESFGMACSERELGLSENHGGLLELPADAHTGADLREFLGLGDVAISLELTPNRADCLGLQGLAREVAAICAAPFTPPVMADVPATIDTQVEVRLEAEADCPRYACRVIRGLDPSAPSPLWLRERLRRCGLRSISAVVDVTNYVLLELGQPLHAFDLHRLQGGLNVRRARKGETLVLLDGKSVALDESLLVICDERGPVALAGIMGGQDSGVGSGTVDIVLESAWFQPAVISGRARALGLHTDASHRFERGVDPQGQVTALERATALLLTIAGGEAGPVMLVELPGKVPVNAPVRLRHARLNRVLGCTVGAAEVESIFAGLGMHCERTAEGWEITAPSRRFDIAIEEDLIEEVARIHGYDRLPSEPPSGSLALAPVSEQVVSQRQLRDCLCACGWFETINYAFVDPAQLRQLSLDQDVLPLANPISSEMGVMRTALLPGLLASLGRNLRRQQQHVRLFETGKVFHQRETLVEVERLAGVACGSAWPEQWGTVSRPMDFYDLKRDVERILEQGGEFSSISFQSVELPFLHPGQAAEVRVDGLSAGWLGALHPVQLAALDMRQPVFAFELDLERISKRAVPYAKNISPYPSVRRDLALLVPAGVNFSQIKDLVSEMAGSLLVDLVLFDQFSGPGVETGYKSLAIGLILQDVSSTLTDEVVDSLTSSLVQGLETRLAATLRG